MDKTLDDLNPFLKRFGKRRDDVTAEEWREKFFRPMTGRAFMGHYACSRSPRDSCVLTRRVQLQVASLVIWQKLEFLSLPDSNNALKTAK